MARGFNLTAQINLQGPSNVRQVVAGIRRQLGNIRANVSVAINPSVARNIGQLNSQFTAFNRTLQQTRNTTRSAAQAINDLSRSVTALNTAARALPTSLRGLNNLPNSINRVNTSINNLNNNLNRTQGAARQTNSEFEEFGRQSALAIRRFAAFSVAAGSFYKLSNAISSSFKEFVTFDRELVRVSQVTGTSLKGLESLERQITSLASTYGVASQSLIQVSATLAQAGLTAKDTERALKALALSSVAPSFDDMNQTVEGSIALMRQFNISAIDLEKALGSINAVSAKFAVEASDIIAAIQRTGGVFATASKGVSEGTDALNEFIAVFTSVRATTRESAETIATGLRTIFTRIQRADTIEQLKTFGVVLTDLEGKFVGPFEAVRRLSKGLNELDPRSLSFSRIVEELGGFRQIGKVIPLIQQFAVAQQALKVAQTGQGELAKDASTAQQALAIQFTKVREEFNALVRSIGQSQGFKDMVRLALDLASALIRLADSLKGVLPALTAMAAVKGLGALMQFGRGFVGGIRRAHNGGPIRRFARGGLVPGVGNTDSVSAMLQPGEFVIRKKAVENIGVDKLSSMNRYANGGKVQKFAQQGTPPSAGRVLRKRMTAEERISKNMSRTDKKTGERYNLFGIAALQTGLKDNTTLPADFSQIHTIPADKEKRTPARKIKIRVGTLAKQGFAKRTESLLTRGFETAVTNTAEALAANINSSLVPARKNQKILKGAGLASAVGIGLEAALNMVGAPYLNKTEKTKSMDFPNGLGKAARVFGKNFPANIPTDATKTVAGFGKSLEKIKGQASRFLDAVDNKEFTKARIVRAGSRLSNLGSSSILNNLFQNVKDTPQSTQKLVETLNLAHRALPENEQLKIGRVMPQVGSKDIQSIMKAKTVEAQQTALQQLYKRVPRSVVQRIFQQKFAYGGGVSGEDTVPALLTPGEFVINKKSASRIGSAGLNKLNSAHKIKGFNKGGPVGPVLHFQNGGAADGSFAKLVRQFKEAGDDIATAAKKARDQMNADAKKESSQNKKKLSLARQAQVEDERLQRKRASRGLSITAGGLPVPGGDVPRAPRTRQEYINQRMAATRTADPNGGRVNNQRPNAPLPPGARTPTYVAERRLQRRARGRSQALDDMTPAQIRQQNQRAQRLRNDGIIGGSYRDFDIGVQTRERNAAGRRAAAAQSAARRLAQQNALVAPSASVIQDMSPAGQAYVGQTYGRRNNRGSGFMGMTGVGTIGGAFGGRLGRMGRGARGFMGRVGGAMGEGNGMGGMMALMAGGAGVDMLSRSQGGENTAAGRTTSVRGNAALTGAGLGMIAGQMSQPILAALAPFTGGLTLAIAPFAPAIGAAIGGLIGFASSAEEASSSVKELAIEQANSAREMAAEKTGQKLTSYNTLADRAAVGKMSPGDLKMAKDAFFGSLKDLRSKEDISLQAEVSKGQQPGETRDQYIQRLSQTQTAGAEASQNFIVSEMQRTGKSSSEVLSGLKGSERDRLTSQIAQTDPKYIEKQLEFGKTIKLREEQEDTEGANRLRQTALKELAILEQQLTAERLKEADILQKSINEEKARAKAMQEAEHAARQMVISLQKTVDAMNQSTNAGNFAVQQRMENIEAISSGKSRPVNFDKNINILENPRAYSAAEREKAINQSSFGMGADADPMRKLAEFSVSGRDRITSVVAEAKRRGDTDPETIKNDIYDGIKEQLAGTFGDNAISSTMLGQLETKLDELFRKKEGETVTDAEIQEVLDSFGPLNDMFATADAAMAAMAERAKLLNNAFGALSQATQKAIDIEQKRIALKAGGDRDMAEIDNRVNTMFGKKLSLEDMGRPRLIEASQLAGVRPENYNTKGLTNRLKSLEGNGINPGLIQQKEAQLQQKTKDAKTEDEIKALVPLQQELDGLNQAAANARKGLHDLPDFIKANMEDTMSKLQEAVDKFYAIQAKSESMAESIVTSTPEGLQEMNSSYAMMDRALKGNLESINQNVGAQQAYYKTLQQGGTFQEAQQAAQASYAQQLQNSLKMFDDMAELGGMDKQQRNFMKADMLENMANTQGIMSPMLRGMIDNLRKTPEMDPETQKLMAVLETQKAQYEEARRAVDADLLQQQKEIMIEANQILVDALNTTAEAFNNAQKSNEEAGINRPGDVVAPPGGGGAKGRGAAPAGGGAAGGAAPASGGAAGRSGRHSGTPAGAHASSRPGSRSRAGSTGTYSASPSTTTGTHLVTPHSEAGTYNAPPSTMTQAQQFDPGRYDPSRATYENDYGTAARGKEQADRMRAEKKRKYDEEMQRRRNARQAQQQARRDGYKQGGRAGAMRAGAESGMPTPSQPFSAGAVDNANRAGTVIPNQQGGAGAATASVNRQGQNIVVNVQNPQNQTNTTQAGGGGVFNAEAVTLLANKFDNFIKNLQSLNIPTEFVHNHQVNVNINGAEVFNTLSREDGPLAQLVVRTVNAEIGKVKKDLSRKTEGAIG